MAIFVNSKFELKFQILVFNVSDFLVAANLIRKVIMLCLSFFILNYANAELGLVSLSRKKHFNEFSHFLETDEGMIAIFQELRIFQTLKSFSSKGELLKKHLEITNW